MKKSYKIFKNVILCLIILLSSLLIVQNNSYAQTLDTKRLRMTSEQKEQFDKFLEKEREKNDFARAESTRVTVSGNVATQINRDLESGRIDAKTAAEIIKDSKDRDYAFQLLKDEDTNKCPDALKPDPNLDVTNPNSSNLFAASILTGMKSLMMNVYKSLAKLMMLGHGLFCYATQVDYTCLGIESITGCAAKLPNLNFLFSGALIYASGALMSMAIGMYFVDISFKLGFAVLFMPISIALWPFPPTKNKLSENLSIIIRSGMLFALVAIVVSFTIILIKNGVFSEQVITESDFWDAIANKSTGQLSEGFSLDSEKILIILFCLIYGFKILSSGINTYLDYFFSDAVFGSESPMHMMGTQAVGMVTQNTIKPAAQFARDVALTQTGRAIAGLGGGIKKLTTKDGRKDLAGGIRAIGRGVRKTTRAIANPRQTYNQAMQYGGKLSNKGIHAFGNVLKEAVDTAIIPFTANEELRDKVSKKMDKGINYLGSGAENIIAHGGGKARDAAIEVAKNIADHEKQKDFVAAAGAAALNTMNPYASVTPQQVRAELHTLHEGFKDIKQETEAALMMQAVGFIAEKTGKSEEEIVQKFIDFGQKVQENKSIIGDKAISGGLALAMAAKTGVLGILSIPDKGVDAVEALMNPEKRKNLIAAAGAAALNTLNASSADALITPEQVRQQLHTLHDLSKKLNTDFNKFVDSAPINLQPSAVISAPFKAIRKIAHTDNPWEETLKNMAYAKDAILQLKNENKKVILKKTGEIMLRTVVGVPLRGIKGAVKDGQKVGNAGLNAVGSILQGFGESLADNSGHKTQFTSWSKLAQREEENKARAREEAAEFRSLADKYDK